jgi:hypothetical protein
MARKFKVLIFEGCQGKEWAAQCLDYDIAVQAKTFRDLVYELSRVLKGHIIVSKQLGVDPFAGLPMAPKAFWDLADKAKTKIVRDLMPFGAADNEWRTSQLYGKIVENCHRRDGSAEGSVWT